MPCPDERLVFVASSLPDEQRAEQEITLWAKAHGYHLRPNAQTFQTFHADQPAQEWRLLERVSH